MNQISSRTPEGSPNHCPVCDKRVWITPSDPAGDAPCPHCGVLLWFVVSGDDIWFFDKPDVSVTSEIPCNASPGDLVRIRSGPFESFDGTLAEINAEEQRATVFVEIFGREVPTELRFDEFEALSK